jgi:hypothetical protein
MLREHARAREVRAGLEASGLAAQVMRVPARETAGPSRASMMTALIEAQIGALTYTPQLNVPTLANLG